MIGIFAAVAVAVILMAESASRKPHCTATTCQTSRTNLGHEDELTWKKDSKSHVFQEAHDMLLEWLRRTIVPSRAPSPTSPGPSHPKPQSTSLPLDTTLRNTSGDGPRDPQSMAQPKG